MLFSTPFFGGVCGQHLVMVGGDFSALHSGDPMGRWALFHFYVCLLLFRGLTRLALWILLGSGAESGVSRAVEPPTPLHI